MNDDRKKILIADDEESIRTTLEYILEDLGFKVVAVSSGADAMEKANTMFFNVAILDYKLPDMDGVQLGKGIKEIAGDTEIIILTGKATLESAIKAVKEDIYDYLTKPVDPNKLIEVISGALDKQRLILENKRLLWELKKSNKELERLNKFKDGLISMISHDLRSPISSLQGFNYSLLEGYAGELSQQQREIIQIENEAIETMMEIINNLLDIRQIEAGKLKMEKEIMDLKEKVIEPVLKRFKPQLDEKSLKLDIRCDDNLPNVNIDPGRLSQVLQNLVQNAIKFTPEKGTIFIGAAKTDEKQVELRVADTGKGIQESELNTIFDVFYSADEEKRERESKGRGLGLAICKEIVKAHGGTVWAESEGTGKGSAFIVVIPINGDGRLQEETDKGNDKKNISNRG